MPTGNAWNDERDAYLRLCREQGMSFSQTQESINRKFQVYYSRNACIGRAKRIGIGESAQDIARRRSQVAVKREEKKRYRADNPERVPRRRRTYGVVEPAPEAVPLAPIKPTTIPLGSIASRVVQAAKKVDQEKAQSERRPRGDMPHSADNRPIRCVEIEPRHLTLLELEPDDCRYPYGEGSITFCGHSKRGGSSYCEAHAELVRGDRRGRHEMTEFGRAVHRKLLRPAVITLQRDFSGESDLIPN